MFVLLVVPLFGCEVVPSDTSVADPREAWRKRQAALANLTHWSAIGRVGVRASNDSWTASLRWTQEGEHFRIRLSGPLGQGALRLQGRPGSVQLRTSDSKTYVATDIDELLAERTGFKVPVSLLRHWMLGRAGPRIGVESLVLDSKGRLQYLKQAGWVVEVQRYGGSARLPLPVKLKVKAKGVTAVLMINRWLAKP